MSEALTVLTLKVLMIIITFFLLKGIREIKQKMDSIFAEHEKFQNILLIISGIYMGISQMQLLPYSNKLFEQYYNYIDLSNCNGDEANCLHKITPRFPTNYLVPCFAFGLIMFFEKILGYDHDEQCDELIEDIGETCELQELNYVKDMEYATHLTKAAIHSPHESSLSKDLIQNNTYNQQLNDSNENFQTPNFLYINFSIFLVGFSLGSTTFLDHYFCQQSTTFVFAFLIACQYSYNIDETDLKLAEKDRIHTLFSLILCFGIICGMVLSFYKNLLFISYVVAFNSGTLLYISTMRLIQKYYDTAGNKFIYYLSYTTGYLGISYILY